MSSKIDDILENIDKMNNCPVPQCPSLPCGALLTCQDCWRRALEEVRADAIRKFADKIKLHMIKYCHGRLDQQYCAIEIIDYIGKLMGEKDYSIDVEAEMKKHDEKVRQEALKEVLDTMHKIYAAGLHCMEDMCESVETGYNCEDCLYKAIESSVKALSGGKDINVPATKVGEQNG